VTTGKNQQLSIEGDRGVNEHEAAKVLGVSVALLRFWRWKRTGPRFRKIGRRVVYLLSDLHAFINSRPAGGARVA
jgi:hypothetical protein